MTTDTTTKAPLDLVEFRPLVRNSLRGFATIKLRNGLVIHDVPVLTSNGKAWASLPSKPLVDKDGVALKDKATGKLRYSPILEWSDRATSDRFSDAVVGAVEAAHPGAVS